MSKTMKTQYKCRMCGEVFELGATSSKTMFEYLCALTHNESHRINNLDVHGMDRHTLHFHGDGSIGFADLVGAVPE